MLAASLVFALYASTQPTSIKVKGGELVNVWDARGELIRGSNRRPQYFLVRLPTCDGRRALRVDLTLGNTRKRYKLECAPDVYLEWERTRPAPTYIKELIRR